MICSRARRTSLMCAALAILACAVARGQTADDACMAAPVEGQKLRQAGRLLDARARFSHCAIASCPPEIVQDCTRWVAELETTLPSVVLAARDGGGADVTGVRVSIDHGPPIDLTGRGLALDPGRHHFVFRRSGSPDLEQQIMLLEGEKNRAVTATFADHPSQELTHRPIPVIAWVAGIGAVFALGSFATFGALGVSERSSSHCDTGCTADQKTSVDAKLLAADVSLVVGVVALAAATVIYLVRPTVRRPVSATLLRF